ncbi:DUF485 domain-containing protein [Streptomyces capitiformicae]|uniref:DUF485 domain-containing protein n=1 Tax=Streptomyces capitiformicae TaxID=2014920 RepID=A0A919LAH8_9ACTN|nr:DUF485 domain-containing protein [Streptomyces capitiformicae]GHH88839.1 hypothetical protein GCM10017771_35850 [Streptomyces capitiformicae]
MTGAVLGLYLLNVVLAAVAPDFMGAVLLGPLSVGLASGLVLCAATAGAVQWYARYAAAHLDPVAERLLARREGGR